MNNLDSSEQRLAELQTELDGLRAEVGPPPGRFPRRAEAAGRLGKLVTRELEQLAMARAVVRVRVAQRAPSQRCRRRAGRWSLVAPA